LKLLIFLLNCLLLLSTFTTSTQVALQAQQFQTGHYEGHAYNTTAHQQGKAAFDLYAFDPSSHRVHGYFGFSDGLSGDAWLTGTIDDRGDLVLSGKLLDFAMQLHGQLAPNGTITATYSLTGATTQEGTCEVKFEHPLTSSVAPDLIGAWEIGGGLPSQTNPITGEASGISFVEARRLEIFPEGYFKHVQSHRHCEGNGLRRCCEEQATLEQGALSFDDRRVTFNVEGGGTISRNTCNPSSTKEGTVTPRKVSFQWMLKRANGAAKLCLQGETGEKACYQKQ
jgi:hypothetical protein